MEAEGLSQDVEEAAECGLDTDTLQQTAAEALLTMCGRWMRMRPICAESLPLAAGIRWCYTFNQE